MAEGEDKSRKEIKFLPGGRPLNEVEVRRGEHVHATDGDIGRVQGLVIDPSDHHVTHVLLQEGHLWGRRTCRQWTLII
jgi:hypothetical protein